tara:strand:+ start:584 stop:1312 length:729 start_codon:yes stop_codon:yes gene_type:complete
MATYYNPKIVTDGLALFLDASNVKSYPKSGTAWKDLSGKGNDATLLSQNQPTYNSNFGGYFDFDGTNDTVSLPPLSLAGNELTFSLWNYGIESKNSGIIFLGNTGDNAGGRILSVHLPYSSNIVYFDKGTTPDDGTSGPGTQYDRINKTATNVEYQGWHHWAFTANAVTGSMKIYLDSVLWHSGTGKTKAIHDVTGDTRIIGSSYSGGFHRAYVSNMQLYKKELSSLEVLQNFNALRSRFGV